MTRFVICPGCQQVRSLADMRDKLRCKFCPVQSVAHPAIRPGEDAVEAQLRQMGAKR